MSIFPLVFGFSGLGGIAYFNADYMKRTDGRKDANLAYTVGASRPLLPWLNLSLIGSYTDNQSTLTANTFNKYMLMSAFTANWSF